MQVKIGCDIVNLKHFKKILKRAPGVRERIFLPEEEQSASLESLAGIFAAKEAVIKALGLKAGDWKKIEVTKNKHGRPAVKLRQSKKRTASQSLSISHDGEYALAVACFLIDNHAFD